MSAAIDPRPPILLANLLELPDGRVVEWEAIGTGEPLLWIEGGPGIAAHLARLARDERSNVDAVRAWAPEPPINLLPELAAIRCPTLVVAGERDFICGPSWNRPIADAIPGAVYAEIAGVGHLPQYEAPVEFRRIVLDWLAATGG